MTLAAGSRIGPYEIQALLGAGGMGEERELERALRDDPVNLLTRTTLGFLHIGTGDTAAGERELQQVLEFDGNFWIAHAWLCGACIGTGRWSEALHWAEKARAVVPQHRAVAGLLAGLLTRAGEQARSTSLREQIASSEVFGAPAGLFYFHAALADWEKAAFWFGKAVDQHDTRAPWILPRMFGDRLTSSPYWPALAKKMNLPV